MKSLTQNKGFTLVEVLVVVIIVALLAAISVPMYLSYVKGARAAEPQTAIGAIWNAEKIYYQKYGVYEPDIEKLDVDSEESTLSNWEFRIDGSRGTEPPTRIIGTSTEEFPGGAGQEVVFEVATGQWTGYGTESESD